MLPVGYFYGSRPVRDFTQCDDVVDSGVFLRKQEL